MKSYVFAISLCLQQYSMGIGSLGNCNCKILKVSSSKREPPRSERCLLCNLSRTTERYNLGLEQTLQQSCCTPADVILFFFLDHNGLICRNIKSLQSIKIKCQHTPSLNQRRCQQLQTNRLGTTTRQTSRERSGSRGRGSPMGSQGRTVMCICIPVQVPHQNVLL